MEDFQRRFIEFMVRADVLRFGDFVTKSGRNTPYFVNTGRYRTGAHMRQLGHFYADTIEASGASPEVLFGPAYKGIPLVVATAAALAERGSDVAFCFNRKEQKDHGEGGVLVGHQPSDGDRVMIIEDVTTAGTSIRETVPLLRQAADIKLVGLVISIDRCERGKSDCAALEEVGREFEMPTHSIATVYDVIEHLSENEIDGSRVINPQIHEKMLAYLNQYGAQASAK